jgi:hypothetical protein
LGSQSKLARFYRRVGIDDESHWAADRLKHIAGDEAAHSLLDSKEAS